MLEFDAANIEKLKTYLKENREQFEQKLLEQASNVKDKIGEIRLIGNIHLIDNAYKLVTYVIEDRVHDVFKFAQQEGVAWAKSRLTLHLKLEWVQAIRRTLWHLLERYEEDVLIREAPEPSQFYRMEKRINDLIDQFLHGFFTSYSEYKDHLIERQQKLVDHLSAPIIPVTDTISVLPLIGAIDSNRARILEEKILMEIGKKRISRLFIDLSGIAEIATDTMKHLIDILDGVEMMGCHPVITGLQPKIVQSMIRDGIGLGLRADTKANLQQALKDYLTFEPSGSTSQFLPK